MDLISCRNLLIYLNHEAQQRTFDIFHFAMKPGGLLLLGSSETINEGTPLFRIVDKKHRIYAQQSATRVAMPIPTGPSSLLRAIAAQEQARAAPVVHGKHFVPDAGMPFQGRLGTNLDRASLAELHFKLLEHYSPPSVIINAEHEIVHLSEHVGEFMQFSGGEPTTNLLRVVLPALRVDLRTTLFRAADTNQPADSFEVPAEIGGQSFAVHLRAIPAAEIAAGFLLVTFDKRPPGTGSATLARDSASIPEPIVRQLEGELQHVKGSLRDTVERYEASAEELKASNEELQAMNEELRSATEELETSREELQSINEELTTVNQEMKIKMEEVAHANSDLQNLMASTSIATVFLDRELAITRFTPAAADIFNMIPGDVGRPLGHLKYQLEYPDLIADVALVLRTLIPIEREVRNGDSWYFARVQPYRTLEDHIAGVVLTLVDITERNRAIEALRESEERMRLLIESAQDYAIFTVDLERRVNTWNTGAEIIFGYAEAEILGQAIDILFTPEDRAKGDPQREIEKAHQVGRAQNERWHARKDGSIFYGSGSVMPLRDKAGNMRGFVKIMRDLTESKRSEDAMREHLEELTRFNAAAVGRETRMIDLKKEINALCARLGEPPPYALAAEREEERPRES
jgi:two-component system CheB/CheR fusion protein